ncbi:acyl-CoA oxidase [Heterostelium album PN500]|uniref:Acyl-coenzyme A oxidase n=1 Tax=Heterostelium pallidum (strain ATCC 26659 / Pp 5 / PN500) TaxID=670386 RepID=D3B131_HETP5|nr:acyl-CoA oxidase [Heterostelium album PN500]EFA85005.1 acyl-CoA oxidase [Heterostelium album PN500]|eukprot:XP_020437115.1 acyl-CoA oxidase [Heterostelium album PN500]
MTQNFKPSIDINVLYRIRNGPLKDYQSDIDEFQKLIADNRIKYNEMFDVDMKTQKRLTNDTVKEICKLGKMQVQLLKDDPKKMLAYLYALFAQIEFSAIAKIVIHFQLFGGTILEVGTDYHHQKYFNDINNFNIVGGFAMTEMGHGSNVRQIETTSTYDLTTKEFVINSPSLSSTKFWIGNVSMFGTHVVLFTKLIFQGQDKGVHVIIVPLRDPVTMEVYKGIQLGDCGHKVGWNGIDNAWIRFTNYRVPRENLLNRFATITEDGQYLTNISSPNKLFQITISQLVFGRLLYIFGPTIFLAIGLKTAIRYAFSRRQFGEKGKPEELIIDYPTHNRVLLPMLATNMVFEFSRNWIIDNLQESSRSDEKREEYHSIVSGVKAMVCEFTIQSVSKLRVFCGGNGVSSYNYFGAMRNDLDVFQTAEGDGAVLYQQLSKFLLSEYKKWYKKQGMTGYIMKEVQTFLTTSNPIHTHYRSMPYLLSNEFHHHAFLFRFEKTRSIVIDHLNQCKGKGLSFLQSWNASLIQVVDLAKTYTHLFILENAQRTIQKVTDPITRHVLNDIVRLYALYNIEQDVGFYRNWNYLSSGKALAISEAVGELCNTLKPYALSILDSHKFHEDSLNIPLAKKDLDYVKHMADRVGIPYSSL